MGTPCYFCWSGATTRHIPTGSLLFGQPILPSRAVTPEQVRGTESLRGEGWRVKGDGGLGWDLGRVKWGGEVVPSWTLLKLDREGLRLLFFFNQWQMTWRSRVTHRSDSSSITLRRLCRGWNTFRTCWRWPFWLFLRACPGVSLNAPTCINLLSASNHWAFVCNFPFFCVR